MGGDGNILHLDHDGGCMTVHIYQNSSNYTLKSIHFIVYKLSLNKPNFIKIIKYRFLLVTQLKSSQIG